jgi:hypothetical protein
MIIYISHACFAKNAVWLDPRLDFGRNGGEVKKIRVNQSSMYCTCIAVYLQIVTVQPMQFCISLHYFWNVALKGYLTQRWMAIIVSILQKNVFTKCTPYSNTFVISLIYHLTFSKGRCMTISGAGEICRGGAHLPWLQSFFMLQEPKILSNVLHGNPGMPVWYKIFCTSCFRTHHNT